MARRIVTLRRTAASHRHPKEILDRSLSVGGVTVGENSIIAAGAVVSWDVLANTIVRGVPA